MREIDSLLGRLERCAFLNTLEIHLFFSLLNGVLTQVRKNFVKVIPPHKGY
jgi:hypothetical protein